MSPRHRAAHEVRPNGVDADPSIGGGQSHEDVEDCYSVSATKPEDYPYPYRANSMKGLP